jgi:hypothetical protein
MHLAHHPVVPRLPHDGAEKLRRYIMLEEPLSIGREGAVVETNPR